MFEIEQNDPDGTIAGALKAIGSTKTVDLARRIGLKDGSSFSQDKKKGCLRPATVKKLEKLRAELAEVADPEAVPVSVPAGTISIDSLETDESIQQRAQHIDQDTVERYVDALKSCIEAGDGPWPFPPIVVFRDGDEKHWLADGFHRVETAKQYGIHEIPAEIRSGFRADAMLFAAGANADHGLPRTNADKRRAVMTVLDLAMCSTWSDRRIAEHCRVSHPTVSAVRKEFEEEHDPSNPLENFSSQIDEPPEQPAPVVRETKNGPMNVSGISASNKKRPGKKTPAKKSPAKAAREAVIAFAGKCSDIRKLEAHITDTEIFKIAEACRDHLIWCMERMKKQDVDAFCQKIVDAAEDA